MDELDVRGGTDLAIETGDASRRYLAALDTGKFTLGAPHVNVGSKPNPEEIFSLIKTPDDSKFRFVADLLILVNNNYVFLVWRRAMVNILVSMQMDI